MPLRIAASTPRASSHQQAKASPYYVFDRGMGEGYVIVCGDDAAAESILGYCDSGRFDYDQLPPAMQEWLDGYASQVEQLQARGAEKIFSDAFTGKTMNRPEFTKMLQQQF
jgi:hypothetical protein